MKGTKGRMNTMTVVSWLIAYMILFVYVTSCSYDRQPRVNLVVAATEILCLMVCSVILKRWIIPRFLYRRKIVQFCALLLLLIVFFSLLMQVLHSVWYSMITVTDSQTLFEHYYYQLFSCWWVIFCGCLCILAFKVIQDQWMAINRNNQLQKEKAQTELNFLKAQINPHFLFNSINSIYANIDRSNNVARTTMIKFSEMLRYQLYECNVDRISFEKEYNYLTNYVALQRLRKEDNLLITLKRNGEMNDFMIAPLLIIPFVENAFKYSSNYRDKENYLKIDFRKESDVFHFHCINSKDMIQDRRLFEDGGIGIQNVKRRLELIYPLRHELQIEDRDSFFEVQLKINIG